MQVTYFRPHRPGPEAEIEQAVIESIPVLFGNREERLWTGGSVPIGAGMPDLVVATWEPEVVALASAAMPSAEILAYLRAVHSAKLDTITGRVNRPRRVIVRCLDDLLEADAVSEGAGTFALNPAWRHILPEIVTVEAKVKNWRDAVSQAARNRLFAHRCYVALPERVAERVRPEAVFKQFGLGLLSVAADHRVQVARRPRRRRPRVWTYYYRLATMLAASFQA